MFVQVRRVFEVEQGQAVAADLLNNCRQGVVGRQAFFAAEKTNNRRMVFHKAFLVKDNVLMGKFLPLRKKSFYGLHDLSWRPFKDNPLGESVKDKGKSILETE